MSLKNLEKALSWIIHKGEIKNLAIVLDSVEKTGEVSYGEVKSKVPDPEELLLLAEEKKLLLPKRTSSSMAWEDRILLFNSGERYKMPRIIKQLVKNAKQTGKWDLKKVTTDIFREMGQEASDQIPELIESLGKRAEKYIISATQIKKTCEELSLADKVDTIVAELKGAGVMSPKPSKIKESRLKSFEDEIGNNSPIYELNPSLGFGTKILVLMTGKDFGVLRS